MSSIDDSETELHRLVQQTLSENRSSVEIIDAVRENSASNGIQNENGLTPVELALKLDPAGTLAKAMIQAECENLSPVESLKRVMVRGNFQLVQILMKFKRSQHSEAAVLTALEHAYAELRTRNVALSPEIVHGVQYLLVEADYKCFGAAKINREEKTDRVAHLIECIEFLEMNYRNSDYCTIDEHFILYLRQILEHVYFLKPHLVGIPLMELQFCLAIFLRIATGEVNESHDIYGFMLDKDSIQNFLKILQTVLTDMDTPKKIDSIVLYKYLRTRQNSFRLPKRILYDIGSNKQLPTFGNVEQYELLSQTQIALLNEYCEVLNKQYVTYKHRKKFKQLLKTYYTTKQFYSIHKIIRSIEIIEHLDLDDSSSRFISIAALKRSLQVIGEAIKSTKQTPNITKKLDSILSIFSAQSFVETTKDLRQFFSHSYSLVKQRFDQDCPVDLFRSILKNLELSANWLAYVKFLQYVHVFKRYLGRLYRMKSIQQMRSYVEFVGTEFKAKLQTTYEPVDMNEAIRLIQHLIDREPADSQDMKTLKIINRMLVTYRNSIRNDVTSVCQLIDQFFFLEWYIRQDEARIARVWTIVKYMLDASKRHQRHRSVDKSTIRMAPNIILQMRMREADPHRKMILDEIWQRLVKQNIAAIESLEKQTATQDSYAVDETIRILAALGVRTTDQEFVKMVSRRLNNKYFHNLFRLADKYEVLSEVVKDRRVKDQVRQVSLNLECMRKNDEIHYQEMFDQMIGCIRNILLKYGDCDKFDIKTQLSPIDSSALEFYLLQVTEVLCSLGVLKLNIDSLKAIVPVVTSRNLRNYLAHDPLSYDTLADSCSTVKINATYFARNNIFHLYQKSHHLKQRKTSPFLTSFQRKLAWINAQNKFFTALETFDVETIEKLTAEDAVNIRGRNILNKDPISIALNSNPAEFIHQLLHSAGAEKSIFKTFLKLPINLVLKQQIRQLLPNPFRFCYGTAVRFKLIDQLTALKTHPDVNGNLTDQQSELMLSTYNTESFRRLLLEHPIEWLSQSARLKNTLLHWAVLRGDQTMVEHLLIHQNESVNKLNVFRETPLGLAVRYGYYDIVRLLVANGADVNFGLWPPVWVASGLGDLELIPLLVNEQTNKCSVFFNPLMAAVENNHFPVFKHLCEELQFSLKTDYLLQRTLNLNRKDFFQYILQSEHAEALINSPDAVEFSPLMVAAVCGRTELFRQLLRNGANPSYESLSKYTPIHYAVYGGNRDIVLELLQQPGVDINATAEDSVTPIGVAISENNMNMIELMLAKNAQVRSQEILQAGVFHHYHIVRYLIDRDDRLINDSFDIARRNLLMYAIIDGEMSTVEYLIGKGINVNARAIGGLTALHIAAGKNETTLCERLIESGAELDAKDDEGRTALVIALEHEYVTVVELFLDRGAEAELVRGFRYRVSNNASLLHKFALENRITMVRLLLDRFHFDVSLEDDNGESALDYATKQGNDAIVALLKTDPVLTRVN
ncbi:uncharacterized protein LOC128735258 [Sabethes cyaneus]|uniref:uncharacterized protein LOC128735258 n=1 Tax=Sabethes cyaneus TaxID=53552 RepID=UPI00237DDFF2|nr:uncharacterized protein LOC128735258 [Sabethes cyaneus]